MTTKYSELKTRTRPQPKVEGSGKHERTTGGVDACYTVLPTWIKAFRRQKIRYGTQVTLFSGAFGEYERTQ